MRALWRRFDDAGLDWISAWDHLYEAPPEGGTRPALRGHRHARGAVRRDPDRPHRLPRVLRRLPQPRAAGQGGDRRSTTSRAVGSSSASAPAGTSRRRRPTATTSPPRHPVRHAGGGGPADQAHAHPTRTARPSTGRYFRAADASCLPRPVQDRAADLDRRCRREADATDGGPPRRRLERGLHRARGVRDASTPCIDDCVRDRGHATPTGRCSGLDQPACSCSASTRRPSRPQRSAWPSSGAPWPPAGPGRRCSWARPRQAVERIAAYAAAGADGLNVALRAPWEAEALDAYLDDVVPAVRVATG